MDRPSLDESRAAEYIGKTILLGVTYLDHEERMIGQGQWFGTIMTFDNTRGIRIKLRNADDPCGLPPDPRGIAKGEPGIYKLRSTGEEVVDPDYLATWTCVKPEGDKGLGPPAPPYPY